MGMCNERWPSKRYDSSNNATPKRPCLEAVKLRKWHADGLRCRVNNINSLNVFENVSANSTGLDGENTTCEKS